MLIYGIPTSGKSHLRKSYGEELVRNLVLPDFTDMDDLIIMRGSHVKGKDVWHLRHRLIDTNRGEIWHKWWSSIVEKDMSFATRCIGHKTQHFVSNAMAHGPMADYAFLRIFSELKLELTNRYALEGKTPDGSTVRNWDTWKVPKNYKIEGEWSQWKNPIILPMGSYMSDYFSFNPKDSTSLTYIGPDRKSKGKNQLFKTPPAMFTDTLSGKTYLVVVHPKRSTTLVDLMSKLNLAKSQKEVTLVALVDGLTLDDFRSYLLEIIRDMRLESPVDSLFIHGVQPTFKGGIPFEEISSYLKGMHPSRDNIRKQGTHFLGLVNDSIAILGSNTELLCDRLLELERMETGL